MGLKFASMSMFLCVSLVMLKSDQNGIEISSRSRGVSQNQWLKSDQNGIEIFSHQKSPHIFFFVKIRPKWDWNKQTRKEEEEEKES